MKDKSITTLAIKKSMYNSIKILKDAFKMHPNYKYSKTDWNIHYIATLDILNTYNKYPSILEDNNKTTEFINNLNNHLYILEIYASSGLVIYD